MPSSVMRAIRLSSLLRADGDERAGGIEDKWPRGVDMHIHALARLERADAGLDADESAERGCHMHEAFRTADFGDRYLAGKSQRLRPRGAQADNVCAESHRVVAIGDLRE